jgi:DNA-directed RNA polymerase specialized sigma24 family protein
MIQQKKLQPSNTTDRHATDMHAFVRNLPDTDRRVLMLHYAEELTAPEIAMILELGVSQVENRITALRAVARALLQTTTLSRAG